jgi:hypothetical protein
MFPLATSLISTDVGSVPTVAREKREKVWASLSRNCLCLLVDEGEWLLATEALLEGLHVWDGVLTFDIKQSNAEISVRMVEVSLIVPFLRGSRRVRCYSIR